MTPTERTTPTRLTKIEIENYRAFRGHFEVDLPGGSNLLAYGENGTGKSSLFHSITDFVENPDRRFYDPLINKTRALKYDDYRYRFNTDPARVRLSFTETGAARGAASPTKVYEWSASTNDARTPEMRSLNQGKGCLDYRSLLRINLLPTAQHEVDLFPLFIEVLFTHFRNPVSTPGKTFGEQWNEIKSAFSPYKRKPPDLDQVLASFNAGFERVIKDAFRSASSLLEMFDRDLAADVEIAYARYIWPPKVLFAPRVVARPSFRLLAQPDYYGFLNEARLSALAIAIYFAALKQLPAPQLRLLILDDILIGLDMVNRMAVLRIIEKEFQDWQVFILTYHKAWFEILKARIDDSKWSYQWRNVTFRLGKSVGTECPIIVAESSSLLTEAREQLNRGDAKAAAVYARTAWESIMGWYCSKWRLPVEYAESRRNLNTEAFLSSITRHLDTLGSPVDHVWAIGVIAEIKHARRFILNPTVHFSPELEDEISAEIDSGIAAVEDFEVLLRCVARKDFAKPTAVVPIPAVGLLLQAAAEHLEAGRNAAAREALASAFQRHMDELFRDTHERVPYGDKIDSEYLLNWAGRRLYKKSLSKLRRARPYLLGIVSDNKFDLIAFRSARECPVDRRN